MTLAISTEDELVNAAIPILRRRGYRLVAGKYEGGEEADAIQLKTLAQRLGVQPSSLTDALNHRDCPAYNCRRSPAGQIREFRPNPAVFAWLIQRLGKTQTLKG